MYEDVVLRLESLGFTVEPATDDWVLNYLIGKVTNTIKNECNVTKIPEGLHHVAVDMVCGEFLQMKRGGGQLDELRVLKQISEGDTTLAFATDGESITFDGLVYILLNSGRDQFITYRKLKW